MLLAVQFIQQNSKVNICKIAQIYKVPYTILCRRIQGISIQLDTVNKAQKLTKLEEETIIQYIFDLDLQAFSPRCSTVEDMANRLLAECNREYIGKN